MKGVHYQPIQSFLIELLGSYYSRCMTDTTTILLKNTVLMRYRMVKAKQRVKTFASEQKMLLFTQIGILFGLLVQVIIFFALIWYGRPPATDYELVLQFFTVTALWIFTINIGVVLFWWVSRLGEKSMFYEEPSAPSPVEELDNY